ncbi:MAG: TetR/AcrR family transcriptional regulator [Cyclobacteriaceae bacterium]|nr:TetR/AcrR family transcriptional regulator [Cyclobacteriaceae bacterium HetDA_MAG_MS6]
MPKKEAFDREEVLEKATKVFWVKGYHATSVQDLVDATGLNRSSIYNSFTDKLSLFFEVIKYYRERQQSVTHRTLLEASSPKQAISQFIQGLIDQIVTDRRHKGCLISNSTTEVCNQNTEIMDLMRRNQQEMESLFAELIQSGQQLGEIKNADSPRKLAAFLFSSIQGLQVIGILNHDETYLANIKEQILSVL